MRCGVRAVIKYAVQEGGRQDTKKKDLDPGGGGQAQETA